ncbi:MAG TPA: DNA repair exonuclease [Polyangiales bacterium]|nr:DNA repair exonuclease [Polyangiales bacterium]
MKFVHAADLHLDSPLRGLARNVSVPIERVRTATRRALSNLVELCIEEEARLLVLAGDLYDGDWRDYSTGLYFAHQMARLREAGVQVAMIRGNHDAASQITKNLRLPDNVRELSYREAETVCFDDLGIALHGQSFATRAVLQNLAESYPARVPHLLNIGLLHTSINGREGHEPYAPCSIDLLKSKGYDYWALGHVHAREVVCDAPWIVFPGNLQGRHARETGEKGATVVHYDEHGVRSVEARALDVVRYATSSIDLGEVTSYDDALDRVRLGLARELERADGRMIGVRIVLTGATPLHARLVCDDGFVEHGRALALDLGGEEMFIEKAIVRTSAQRDAEIGEGPLAELLAAIESTRRDETALSELVGELSDLRPKLPPELREGEDGLRLDDPQFLASQLDAIEQLLITRLRDRSER